MTYITLVHDYFSIDVIEHGTVVACHWTPTRDTNTLYSNVECMQLVILEIHIEFEGPDLPIDRYIMCTHL